VRVLVDTSVWVDHLRKGNPQLAGLLDEGQVVSHRFVIGELACGTLRRRDEILGLLAALPAAPVVEHDEVLEFLDAHGLAGRGLGWIDMHLLASATLGQCAVWTLDKALGRVAADLKLA
jgi:predicted nucleic acid-binding protein